MTRCKRCEVEKPPEAFRSPRGQICKDCDRDRQNVWRRTSAKGQRKKQREAAVKRDPERRARENAKVRERWKDPEYAARRRADRKLYYQRVMADPQKRMLWNLRKQAVRYGLKASQITEQIARQRGRCANSACRVEFVSQTRDRWPCIDHDHDSGVLRGILCNACNMALGWTKDSPKRLAGLVRYLATGAWTEPLEFPAAQ